MNGDFLRQTVVKNWYLFVVLIAFLLTAVYQLLVPGTGEAEAVPAQGTDTARLQRTAPSVAPRDLVAEERAKTREDALAKIHENEAALAEHPEPERAAALTTGIANMYFQRLQDYSVAASHYERVLSDYPDAPLQYQTFIQLVQCYEHLNDQEKRRDTLRRMMEAFPKDSQQYAYAHSELYGELPATLPSTDAAVETAGSTEVAASARTEPAADATSVQ